MSSKISGVVQRHLGRGKKLGFPTANLETSGEIEDGIYLGLVSLFMGGRGEGEGELPALVFVGEAKTFGETKRWLEVHVLDFEGELYGKKIEVELIKKIRGNKKFKSKQALIEQMKLDEKNARLYFGESR